MSVYLVTGATGYMGSMLIKHILQYEQNAEVIALVRDPEKAENMLGKRIRPVQADLTDGMSMNSLMIPCDYLLHCASVTKSAEMVSHPVEVTESIVNATQNIMKLAMRSGIKGMAYLSSMEVYGRVDCSDGHRVSEDELGEIDIFSVRSCYPLGKRMAENICYSYFKEYGVPVKIARLAQTFGKGVLPADNRVFVQFAKAAKNGTDIVLHTEGTSMGNYCAVDDAVEGILTVLYRGKAGEAYNIVNEANTMQIREMAKLVAEKVAGGRCRVRTEPMDSARTGYAPDTGLRLSGEKLRRLGWQPQKGLEEMYEDVIKELKPH